MKNIYLKKCEGRITMISYNVDIVMCIDKTGSMTPIIEEVKRNAINFHKLFVEGMENDVYFR